MKDTMAKINELANERLELWYKAGKQHLKHEELLRLHEISDTLPRLWDQYRRELAGNVPYPAPRRREPRRELVIEGYE